MNWQLWFSKAFVKTRTLAPREYISNKVRTYTQEDYSSPSLKQNINISESKVREDRFLYLGFMSNGDSEADKPNSILTTWTTAKRHLRVWQQWHLRFKQESFYSFQVWNKGVFSNTVGYRFQSTFVTFNTVSVWGECYFGKSRYNLSPPTWIYCWSKIFLVLLLIYTVCWLLPKLR